MPPSGRVLAIGAVSAVALLAFVAALVVLTITPMAWTRGSEIRYSGKNALASYLRKSLCMAKWMPMHVPSSESNLLAIHSILEEEGIPFWLSEGTALGAVREGRIMPHDDDVDIAVRHEHLRAFEKRALPRLLSSGFRVAKVWNSGRFVTLVRMGEPVDVDFVEEGRECAMFTKEKLEVFSPCRGVEDVVRGLRPVRLLGRNFLVPDVSYLERKYGESWRIPA